MQTTPPVSASTDKHQRQQIFPFFRLATELRDEIYDSLLLLETRVVKNGANAPFTTVEVTDLPSTNHLLVCRQFCNEYRSRAAQLSRSTLTITETSEAPVGRTEVLVIPPRTLEMLHTLVLNLACRGPVWLGRSPYMDNIVKYAWDRHMHLLGRHTFRKIHITMTMAPRTHFTKEYSTNMRTGIVGFANRLSSFDVYCQDHEELFDFGCPRRRHFCQWSLKEKKLILMPR